MGSSYSAPSSLCLSSEVKVAQSCLTLYNPIDSPRSSPGQNIGVGSLSLLQGIFPTQGSNPGLLHCRRILYQLSHKGSPKYRINISDTLSHYQRRQLHPTPVLLPGKSHGWRSLIGCSPWCRWVGLDWTTSLSLFTFMHWRRKWQPTLVLLLGESQGWGSLVGSHLWGRAESDTTEVTQQQLQ